MKYLAVKNFEKFQHYKERRPPWIKLHNSLLDDFGFLELSEVARSQLMLLWLIASRHGNRIPSNDAFIRRSIHAHGKLHIRELLTSGFLLVVEEDDSVTLAVGEHDASEVPASRAPAPSREGEAEAEREGKTEQSPLPTAVAVGAEVAHAANGGRGLRTNGSNPRSLGTNPRAATVRDAALIHHIRDVALLHGGWQGMTADKYGEFTEAERALIRRMRGLRAVFEAAL